MITGRSITSDDRTRISSSCLRESSFVAVLAASERTLLVRVLFADGSHQCRVLVVDRSLVTRPGRVDERVGHVELGQVVNCP